ncbi:MAG: alkaline phosphatase family protein [Prevotellaceae bacterium]|nr:alkaline phosphatase family protein [Prevotellaceae bacterium]
MTLKKYLLLILFSINCISINCISQNKHAQAPSLVVGIVIDGLQQRHFDLIRERLSPDGLQKIADEGSAFPNAQYNILSAGNTADIATLMTGSAPYYHGITGNRFFNRKKKTLESILWDENQTGIGSSLKLSAKNLLASTFTDELKMAMPSARIFAVGINPEDVVMLGGHTANAVVWLDDAIRWSTTGYYNGGLPKAADEMNMGRHFSNYIFSVWKPLKSIDTYLNKPTNETMISGFRYDLRFRNDGDKKISDLKNSPAANSLVTELAMRMIEDENLGKQSGATDVLMLQYSVRQANEYSTALNSAEKEDMYYRLDNDIAELLAKIEKTVGTANTLIFVTGNQTGIHSPKELNNNNIPTGSFSPKRSMSLLNIYLMALYGNEPWVDGYFGNNIYLNREKIQQKKLKQSDLQQSAADFMLEFEGVQNAITELQIMAMCGVVDTEMSRVRNSYNKFAGGDVVISLLPGWQEIDENDKAVSATKSGINTVPLWFAGWKVKKQKNTGTVFVTDLAPTLTQLLNIPLPNACIGNALQIISN